MRRSPFALAPVIALALFSCSTPAVTPQPDALTPDDAAADGPATDAPVTDAPVCDLPCAEAQFTRALRGEVAMRDRAIRALRAVTEAEPTNGRAFLLYGMAQLSALAEDSSVRYLNTIEPALVRARELLPEDRRIPGWIAVLHVQLAVNGGTEEARRAALAEMTAATDAYPDFNTFNFMLMSPLFDLASGIPMECIRRANSISDCSVRDVRCQNTALVPHNVEGALATFGDLHARVGDRERALSYYRQALASPDASGWGYRSIVQGYIDGIDARIAGFAAGGTGRPQFFSEGRTSCVGCHAPSP